MWGGKKTQRVVSENDGERLQQSGGRKVDATLLTVFFLGDVGENGKILSSKFEYKLKKKSDDNNTYARCFLHARTMLKASEKSFILHMSRSRFYTLRLN